MTTTISDAFKRHFGPKCVKKDGGRSYDGVVLRKPTTAADPDARRSGGGRPPHVGACTPLLGGGIGTAAKMGSFLKL